MLYGSNGRALSEEECYAKCNDDLGLVSAVMGGDYRIHWNQDDRSMSITCDGVTIFESDRLITLRAFCMGLVSVAKYQRTRSDTSGPYWDPTIDRVTYRNH